MPAKLPDAASVDRALDDRMLGLSDKLRAKAWRRIQGRRWGRLVAAEMRAVVEDFARPWSA